LLQEPLSKSFWAGVGEVSPFADLPAQGFEIAMLNSAVTANVISAELSVPASLDFEQAANHAVTQIAAVILGVLQENGDAAAQHGGQLLGLIDNLPSGAAFDALWCPAMRDCFAALSPDVTADAAGDQMLGLWVNALAHNSGTFAEFQVHTPRAIVLQNILLPSVSRVTFSGDTAGVMSEGKTVALQRSASSWGYVGREAALLPQLAFRDICLVDANTLGMLQSWNLALPLVDKIAPNDLVQVQSALDLLEHVNPLYRRWVEKVCRYLQIVDSPDGSLNSGSLQWLWGTLGIARLPEGPHSVFSSCEMLIHECCHQYFHLVALLGPLTLDDAEYFSPFPKQMRKLDLILLGAHAFINVLAFYRDLADVQPELASYCAQQSSAILADVLQIRPLLEDADKYTESGNAFLAPLLRRLQSVSE